jgi:4-hydroxy-3-polyprenylbenzoate decarboxylase
MAYPTLQDFLAGLDSAGELKTIGAEVDPILEVSAISDRVAKTNAPTPSDAAVGFDPARAHLGGPALRFDKVRGSSMPLAINTYGSYRRMEMALGCIEGGFGQLADRIGQLLKPEPPTGLMQKMKKGLELAKIASFAPKIVKSGHCQDVVRRGDEVNLFDLPVIKCWEHDGDPTAVGYPVPKQEPGGGRYITFGGVYTIHPDDAGKDGPRMSRNVGMYRAQILDQKTTAMHWHVHHDGAAHWRAWKKKGEPMPAAIVLGGESVLPYAATAPLPPGISELLLAGFLNQGSIDLVPCKTVDLHVPANAEIVIEGLVRTDCGPIGYDPRTDGPIGPGAHFEGPFGDHTGYYSLPDRYPLFEVTAITHRQDPIYPTTVVGPPPQEDYFLGKATERIFLPLLQTMIPDIVDYHLPMFGAFHNCAFLKIRKEYPLQARRVMHAIWGAGQMAWTKFLIVVDEDVDVHDQDAVLFRLCANCDPGRDVEVVNGPLDILDHAAPRLGAGHKMGFDATAKMAGEEVGGHPVRDWPAYLKMPDAIQEQIQGRWSEFGLD